MSASSGMQDAPSAEAHGGEPTAEDLGLTDAQRAAVEAMIQRATQQAAQQAFAFMTNPPNTPRADRTALFDSKFGRPATFDGNESKWNDFSFKFKAFIASASERMCSMLEQADENNLTPITMGNLSHDEQEESRQVYYTLTMLTSEGALTIVRQAKHSNGYEAFRLLSKRFNPNTRGRNLARLGQILTPNFGENKSELMDRIAEWEQQIEEYDQNSNDPISDSIKCAILTEKTPAEVRTHLLLNAANIVQYAAMRQTIEDYPSAGRSWKSDRDAHDMFHVNYKQGKKRKKGEKGKKGKDSKGKGKVGTTQNENIKGGKGNKGKEGKGKAGKYSKGKGDFGFHRSSSQRSLSSSSTSAPIQGYCGVCGKWGHRHRDCWHARPSRPSSSSSSTSRVYTVGDHSDWHQNPATGWWTREPPDTSTIGHMSETPWNGDSKREGDWMVSLSGHEENHNISSHAFTRTDSDTFNTNKIYEILWDSGATLNACSPSHFIEFPIQESENKHLTTAEGRTLRHYGRKRVYVQTVHEGENMTIDFEVVDVVRPICSSSRAKMRGIETHLTGHDGDYIERRMTRGPNRRLELVARAGLFFLPVTAVGGTRTRADMATRDWWPEQGIAPLQDQSAEAASASASASAAAEDGTEDVPMTDEWLDESKDESDDHASSGEASAQRTAKEAPTPPEPTPQERKWHDLTHVPYARWCAECVRGRGRDDCAHPSHYPRPGHGVVQIDYMFCKQEKEESVVTNLTAVDTTFNRTMCITCDKKGRQDRYAVRCLVKFCRSLGFERFHLQGDGEHSIQDLIAAVKEEVPEAMPRETPKAAKTANGSVERCHQTIQGLWRTFRLNVEKRYGISLLTGHPLQRWLVRHASWIHDRFEVKRSDSKTPFQRHQGRDYTSQLVPIAETVLWREPGPHTLKLREKSAMAFGWAEIARVTRTSLARDQVFLHAARFDDLSRRNDMTNNCCLLCRGYRVNSVG